MAFADPAKRRAYDREYIARPAVRSRRRAAFAAWRADHREERNAYEANPRLTKRAQCLVANCRTRARRRNLEFDLDSAVSDIQRRIDLGVCEVTGVAFDLSPGRKWNSPSIGDYLLDKAETLLYTPFC